MKSQLTLVAAVFFGAMGGSFLTRIIEPAQANKGPQHNHSYRDQISVNHEHDYKGRTSHPMKFINRETGYSR